MPCAPPKAQPFGRFASGSRLYSGLVSRVSGLGMRVSGTGFRDEGFGFRDSSLGFRLIKDFAAPWLSCRDVISVAARRTADDLLDMPIVLA